MQNKKTKIKLEEKDTTTRKASLAGKTSSTRTGPPPEEDIPAGPAGTREGKIASPNYSTMTRVDNQCGVKPQSD